MNGYWFTERVRESLVAARDEATRLRGEYVGTEHLLLGATADPTGEGVLILRGLSVDVDAIRRSAELESAQPRSAAPETLNDLPYTSRAKKVLELAMNEVAERHDTTVDVTHLLAGLVREERGVGARLLREAGVTIERLRAASAHSGVIDRLTPEGPTPRALMNIGAGRLTMPAAGPFPKALLLVGLAALVYSAIGAAEIGTWVMEVFPIFIGVPILVATHRRFPLTPLVYCLIFVHAIILMVGGHYTYAKVPLGFWMRDALHLTRNNYDRIGHFAQGFVPAIIAREVLIRRSPLRRGAWLFFVVTCICLSVSACYELIEWAAAVIGGSSADAFLGTQGDVWDTQWDMLTALIGALVAQVTLTRMHDGQLQRLTGREV